MLFAAFVQRLKAAIQAARSRPASRGMSPIDATRLDAVLNVLERDAWLKGEMLDELREAERVGEGFPLQRSSRVDLAELVRSTTESLAPFALEREITLRTGCAATSVVISADARDLTHIVGRLLASAIASCESGSAIDCQVSLDARWIRLVVDVRGPDDKVTAASAVDDSWAGASMPHAAEWEGPALASVRALVALHGGSVRIETRGVRSDRTLTVSLPGNRAARGTAPTGSSS